jgi:F0F1-type ATP synthase membrane subunit b/b'
VSLNPLEQLDPVAIVAVAAIFLVTYLVLRKLLFLPLLSVMERRAQRLDAARAARDQADALVTRARGEADAIVAGAREAADRLDREVKEELARLGQARRAEAGARAQEIVAAGRDEAARLREAEDARLADELLPLSRQALQKLLGAVDEEALRVMVARVLAGREAR